MTDQTYIGESGEILSQPVTWDGQPLYSQETVREGLFDRDAFAQMRGQLALEEPHCKVCGDAAVYPRYATPDLCETCHRAAWDRIDAAAATQPASTPGNNVWD